MRQEDKANIVASIEIFLFVFLLIVLSYLGFSKDDTLQKAQSNNYDLVCYIDNQEKIISKDKIISYNEENQEFTFTNGFAKNCRLEKRNEI